MSLVTSNTTTKRGLVQFYEKELGLNYGDVSGDTSNLLLEFIARANNAIDRYLLIWAKNAGTWQGDDMNHPDFQIITSNIVSGQRDYSFTNDGNSNRIIDVSKVLILPSTTATNYVEITPIDELNTNVSDILVNTNTGTPTQYGKLSNAIFLDAIPSYNATAGIKMVVNREGSYLVYTDTTKVVGVPAFHEYFYLRPAYEVAQIKGLSNLAQLEKAVIDLEGSERLGIRGKIADFFSYRPRDERRGMRPNIENNK